MNAVLYYQTAVDLAPLLRAGLPRTTLAISAFHFGYTDGGVPYIHLNNAPPEGQPVWADAAVLHERGGRVMIMLGGAGTAYANLFRSFDPFYPLLRDTLRAQSAVSGIDLDVEEPVSLVDLRMLIARLAADFGPQFVITMAPVAEALEGDAPGLGGFSYRALCATEEGAMIHWFNVQCYGGSFNRITFENIVANGFAPSRLVFGLLGNEYNDASFETDALVELERCVRAHPTLRGAALWEYGDTHVSPLLFGRRVTGYWSKEAAAGAGGGPSRWGRNALAVAHAVAAGAAAANAGPLKTPELKRAVGTQTTVTGTTLPRDERLPRVHATGIPARGDRS